MLRQVKPSPLVRGVLRSTLLEPQSNVFVGFLDTKRVKKLMDILVSEDALLCVQSAKHPQGLRLKIFGQMRDREIVEMDGIQLVQRKTLEKTKG